MFWKIPNKIRFVMFLIFSILILPTIIKQYPVVILIFLGGLMNFSAVICNDWKMPVRQVPNHVMLNQKNGKYMNPKEAKLYWLGDIFKIKNRMVSLGDFFIAGGIVLGIISL